MNRNIFMKYSQNNQWKINLPAQMAKKRRLDGDTLNQFRTEQRKLSQEAAEQDALEQPDESTEAYGQRCENRNGDEGGEKQGQENMRQSVGQQSGTGASASLRNLILWSEILGEPVCRKRKRNHGSQSNSGRR